VTPPAGTTLVVLDFSGTLSLDATAFAASDRIAVELRRSGLWDLGIDDPELFWQQLITPTWQEGSTTDRGYVAVMAAAASQALRARGRDAAPDAVRRRVQAFADRYFACSTIAPQWAGCLRALAGRDDAATVVATDHYAEATDHIVAELARLGVDGVPVDALTGGASGAVVVANSADLGCHKASADYWRAVRRALAPVTVARVAVVDDFGANESPSDAYADTARVHRRRAATNEVLTAVFGVVPDIHPFVLPGPAASGDDLGALVARAERFTMNVLSRPS
jgi:hypothetical protein